MSVIDDKTERLKDQETQELLKQGIAKLYSQPKELFQKLKS